MTKEKPAHGGHCLSLRHNFEEKASKKGDLTNQIPFFLKQGFQSLAPVVQTQLNRRDRLARIADSQSRSARRRGACQL
jgi:hypothetical protein